MMSALSWISTRALIGLLAVSFLCAAIAIRLMAPYSVFDGRRGAALPMCSLGEKPILQIELARSEQDLITVLMAGDETRNLSDTRTGTKLDSLLFIPAYTVFLFSLGLLLSRAEPRWAQVAVVLAVLVVPAAALFDGIENRGIVRTLDHIGNDHSPRAGDAWKISTPSLVKWTLITIVLAAYGVIALRQINLWRVPLGVLLLGVAAWIAVTLGNYAAERW